MVNIGLGFALVVASGACIGNWLVPVKILHRRGWAWEHTFFVYSIAQCIIIPWVFAFICDPDLLYTLSLVPPSAIGWVIGMGVLWGLGNAMQSFLVPVIGIGLCSTINPATVIGAGSLLPLLIYNRGTFATGGGWLVVGGFLVATGAIVMSFLAGYFREKGLQPVDAGLGSMQANQPDPSETTPILEKPPASDTRTVIIGSILCVVAGFLASLLNIGFINGQVIVDQVKKSANVPWLAGSSTWALAFSGAALPSFAACIFRFVKNGSFGQFRPSDKSFHWLLVNIALASSSGMLQYVAFSAYGASALMLGRLGPSVGWASFEAVGIVIANFVAIALKEWKRVGSKKAYVFLVASIVALLVAVTLMFLSVELA